MDKFVLSIAGFHWKYGIENEANEYRQEYWIRNIISKSFLQRICPSTTERQPILIHKYQKLDRKSPHILHTAGWPLIQPIQSTFFKHYKNPIHETKKNKYHQVLHNCTCGIATLPYIHSNNTTLYVLGTLHTFTYHGKNSSQ